MFFGKKKKKVLVVDDDTPGRKLVVSLLQDEGFEVLEAVDGLQALEVASSEVPDLIILDAMMPNKNGFDTARAMRDDPVLKSVIILLCTAKNTMGDVEKGFASGANDYITKPFDVHRLREKVKKFLEPEKSS